MAYLKQLTSAIPNSNNNNFYRKTAFNMDIKMKLT